MDPADIAGVKAALTDLGFYKSPWGIDAVADQTMVDGVRAFQRANGLVEDGVMQPDGPTLRAMNDRLAERAPPPATNAGMIPIRRPDLLAAQAPEPPEKTPPEAPEKPEEDGAESCAGLAAALEAANDNYESEQKAWETANESVNRTMNAAKEAGLAWERAVKAAVVSLGSDLIRRKIPRDFVSPLDAFQAKRVYDEKMRDYEIMKKERARLEGKLAQASAEIKSIRAEMERRNCR